MIRNMQNSDEITTTSSSIRSLVDADPEDLVARLDTLRVVSCSICQANYIPSSHEGQATVALLETAFLRVCHRCFRCQRPACPQCWNPLHQVCAACGEEALLPFRFPVPTLEGLVFSPAPSPQTTSAPALPFTCLCNGRFYHPDPPPPPPPLREAPESAPVEISPRAEPVTAPAVLPAPASASSYPVWLQEVMGYKTVEQAGETLPRQTLQTLQVPGAQDSTVLFLAEPENQTTDAGQVWVEETHTGRPLSRLFFPHKKARQARPKKEEVEAEENLSVGERIENVLLLVTSTTLLLIGLMVAFAIGSADMNTLFFQLLHVDFRAEIAYLFQLVIH